ADGVGDAAFGPRPEPPTEIDAFGYVHQSAAGPLGAVLVIVVGMEHVEIGIEGDVAIGIAIANRVDVHLRAVGSAAKDGAGAERSGPAAIGAFDDVVVIAGGDVKPAVIADGQARDLMVMPTAESLGDDLLLAPGAVGLLLVAAHGPLATEVHPAIVDENARRQLLFEDDLGRVIGVFLNVEAEHFDAVFRRLAGDQDLTFRAVLVGEIDLRFRR